MPQDEQWTIGIGVPQNLCLLRSQSRSLYWVFPEPEFSDSNREITADLASSPASPFNSILVDPNMGPYPVKAELALSSEFEFDPSSRTVRISSPYLVANSKSL